MIPYPPISNKIQRERSQGCTSGSAYKRSHITLFPQPTLISKSPKSKSKYCKITNRHTSKRRDNRWRKFTFNNVKSSNRTAVEYCCHHHHQITNLRLYLEFPIFPTSHAQHKPPNKHHTCLEVSPTNKRYAMEDLYQPLIPGTNHVDTISPQYLMMRSRKSPISTTRMDVLSQLEKEKRIHAFLRSQKPQIRMDGISTIPLNLLTPKNSHHSQISHSQHLKDPTLMYSRTLTTHP